LAFFSRSAAGKQGRASFVLTRSAAFRFLRFAGGSIASAIPATLWRRVILQPKSHPRQMLENTSAARHNRFSHPTPSSSYPRHDLADRRRWPHMFVIEEVPRKCRTFLRKMKCESSRAKRFVRDAHAANDPRAAEQFDVTMYAGKSSVLFMAQPIRFSGAGCEKACGV
jgi:hypothetical protein